MIVLILAYLVSLIPGIIIFLWLRNFIYKSPEHLDRKQNCSRAVIYGIVCTIVIVLVSGTSHVVLNQLGLREANPILGEFLYTFIVLAGAEELVKFGTFWQVRKKAPFSYSALDVVITMSLVALGFQFSESIVYAFGTNAPQMIVRGVTLMHMTYGFIMGLFIAKALRTGNKAYYIPAVVIPWILHGLYDFTLAEPVAALSDAVMILPLLLAFISLVLIFVFIGFVLRRHKDPSWTQPIVPAGAAGQNVAGRGAHADSERFDANR